MLPGELSSDVFSADFFFFFSSRRRHTRLQGDWSSDVCSSDLPACCGDLADVRDAIVRNEEKQVAAVGTPNDIAEHRTIERRCEHPRLTSFDSPHDGQLVHAVFGVLRLATLQICDPLSILTPGGPSAIAPS